MPTAIDITGHRFGRLVVLGRQGRTANGKALWLCQCDCGNTSIVQGCNLRSGNSNSCRCYHHESNTPTWTCWKNMHQRCANPNHNSYKHYGGRGIAVCDRWYEFANFLADMGERPVGLSLDRIDNDAGYSPDNCRWATSQQQAKNRRQSRRRRAISSLG